MRIRLRFVEHVLLLGLLLPSFGPKAVAADTVVYATDYSDGRIYKVNVTTGVNTLITQIPGNPPGQPDSLIFDSTGNVLYTLLTLGQLGKFDGTTNTVLASGLGSYVADLTLEPAPRNSVLISDALAPSGPRILRFDLGTNVVSVLSNLKSSHSSVDGLTYDSAGNLFAVVDRNSVIQIDPNTGTPLKTLGGLGSADGITFDSVTGDLWVSRYSASGIWRIPTNLSAPLGPFATQIPRPDGLESDGAGNILIAAQFTNVWVYNIATDTATEKNPLRGLDDLAPVSDLGAPPGYIEICKQSDPDHPVTGTFDFNIMNGNYHRGPISVPVGQCSGSVQVPSGVVTVAESPVLGVAVSDVSAIAYDGLGFRQDELRSWNVPDLHATMNVLEGDVDQETLTTFTNYAAAPGIFKLCKIGGDIFTLGQPFTFTVTINNQSTDYTIIAGPPQQGGNCVLVNTNLPVNTPVKVVEHAQRFFVPSKITVNEGQIMACTPPSIYCGIVNQIPGITEMTFTNILQFQKRCMECENVK